MDPIINKLIPIFVLAFLGFLAGKLRLLPENTSNALCSFLFYFCSPAVSFSNIITSDIKEIFNLRFTLAMGCFELLIFSLLICLYRFIFKEQGTALLIHAICGFYGNVSYVGIPVFLALFNNVIPNIITLLIHGVITSPLIIFLLDWFSGTDSRKNVFHAIKSSFTNPNIFVPIIAAILLFFKIHVPHVVTDSIELLGKPTTTVGMFALGLTCSKNSLRSSRKILAGAMLSSLIKLLVCPALAFVIGKFLFRLDSWWLNSMVILAMLPSALVDFILSQRYRSEEDFASAAVLMSTLLFSITISLYMLLIKL